MSTTVRRTPTSRLRLGHSRVEITPPIGIYHRLWGAARHERATGIHRPLYADVLALAPLDSPPGSHPRLVRAMLDLAGLVQAQHLQMVGALAEGAGVATDQVMLTCSHTHSSGWFVPDRIPLPGGELIVPYLEELTNRLRAAAHEAAAGMRATTISYATGVSSMAANRDYHDAERNIFACGFNPDAPAGGTVLVARFVDDQTGTLSGTLVNYACHPTTLAWENSLISPDYVGALRETVERATRAPCVFAQGACGDIGPRRGFTGDVSLADRNGEQVGYAALEALGSLGPPATDLMYAGPVASGATLGTWRDAAHTQERDAETARLAGCTFTVDLPLRSRPDPNALQREVDAHEAEQRAADARSAATYPSAMARQERMTG